ncbi:MAG: AAA family ATPase [Spirulinaceae cyanobacterium]
MISLSGYEIIKLISESSSSLVYRAIQIKDSQPVVLKVLNQDYPTPEQLDRFKQEYAINCQLNFAGAVKVYGLEIYQRTLVIVFEDFGGESLKQFIANKPLMGAEFLKVAIQIAENLGKIHCRNIIHQDINPANIVIHPVTKQVKITDFGIASINKNSHLPPQEILGTWAYMSPEQTGRMNCSLDYRTDFYSLGATFYELLTQQPPFSNTDPLELVHCHIAKMPMALGSREQGAGSSKIPREIADIVIKLMAKNAEDRYQSAWGLQADLEECLQQLQTTGMITPFPLASQDVSDKFRIPSKLYGRQTEVTQLLAAFKRVATRQTPASPKGGTELFLVAGYSGIGKSALVKEIHRSLAAQGAYFVSGKFEQYQRNIPYLGIIRAFQELVQQLLRENETKLQSWREQIQTALGNLGKVIIEVIPEIELIIGQQPEIPQLRGMEAESRFNLVLQNFVRVFAQPKHPLVIFLDDLQWADSASLQLLQMLATTEVRRQSLAYPVSLLLIGAYREEEVRATHPLRLNAAEIVKAGATVNQIELKALNLLEVNELIADTLYCDADKTKPLAQLVLDKTGGNPFFVREFLQALHKQGLIFFLYTQSQQQQEPHWCWDLEQIKAQGFTNNVVELLAERIQQLPEQTQAGLQLAACIGNQFTLNILATIWQKSPSETVTLLGAAVEENLIVVLEREETVIQYEFVHDRIQQAAYSLIPKQQKQRLHLQIGRLLRSNYSEQELLFTIVNQLNLGRELITTAREKEELAQLNLLVAKKAQASAAYDSAYQYLEVGCKLLSQDCWQEQYSLALEIYTSAAEVAYLSSNLPAMERYIATVLQKGKTLLDKVPVYELKIEADIAQNHLLEAVNTSLTVLESLGIKLPQKPSKLNVLSGLINSKLILLGKKISELVDLPTMQDGKMLAAFRLLTTLGSAAYLTTPELTALVSCKSVALSVKYGNTALSPFTYAGYGVILCGVLGDIQAGYEFGQLALDLLTKLDGKEFQAKTLFLVNDLIKPWQDHLQETLSPLLLAYGKALETGELEFKARAANSYSYHAYFCGKKLGELEPEIAEYRHEAKELRQITTHNFLSIWQQTILNLQGKATKVCSLQGEAYNEEAMLPLHQQANDRTALFLVYFNKLVLCYLFEEYAQALSYSALTAKHLEGGLATITVVIFHFYDSLAKLAIPPNQKLLAQVQANQKKLKKWAKFAPANHLHKYYLVEAERQRVSGKNYSAMEYYDKAIKLAQENGYLQEEALANELAAKFYLGCDRLTSAAAYLLNARYCYQQWGATAKVAALDQAYPQLLRATQISSQDSNSATVTTSDRTLGTSLDVGTVIKASQAISQEIVLDQLLANLMAILLENAGAQKGFLLLATKGKLSIEAEGTVEKEVKVLCSQPLEKLDLQGNAPLPLSIINYVTRTQESLVVKDLAAAIAYLNDPYFQTNQPQSILCAPLLNQGQLSGIIYLENNLTTGAFTEDRLEILNLLSSQAAISIENARSHTEMARLNQAFSRFVPRQFLQFLQKETIADVQLGDHVKKQMSVLFSDIRSFTTLSECMTPEDNFKFINAFLSRMEPAIIENQGFIDKYIGDAIMALFGGSADDAVKAGIVMLQSLAIYNQKRQKSGRQSIKIGIGINTGSLMLGTVGGRNRMDSTVISDAVNLASRIESLTKDYGVSLLISQETYLQLQKVNQDTIRLVGRVKVKGKSQLVTVYEVFEADEPALKESKLITKGDFEQAWLLYQQKSFSEATQLFAHCLQQNPQDKLTQMYLEHCHQK